MTRCRIEVTTYKERVSRNLKRWNHLWSGSTWYVMVGDQIVDLFGKITYPKQKS